jgi:hypothetical protein
MKIELAEDSFMRYFRDISHLKSVVKENMVLTVRKYIKDIQESRKDKKDSTKKRFIQQSA